MTDNTLRSLVLVAAFTALIIVGAVFSFPAPWNPVVPFTMATFFVVLSGLLLGPWRGLAAVAIYLFLGALGLPIFAGAQGGVQVMAGPTGGFLWGYALAAFVGGMVIRLGKNNMFTIILASFLATLAIYLPGLPWMHYRLMGVVEGWSWVTTWSKYTVPFLVGDGIKALAAVLVVRFFRAYHIALSNK